MKNKIILLVFSTCILFSCKKQNVSTCGLPSFSVTIDGNTANINLNSSGSGFYEIEYGANGFTKGTGTKKTVSGNTALNNLALGTYDIYIRGNCGGNSYSEWAGPESFLIDGSSSDCLAPTNLSSDITYSGYYFNWSGTNDYYDIEFGPTGFVLGTGTRIQSNITSTNASIVTFEANKTYDYYIRGNCGASKYSKWAGPKSFYSIMDQNVTVACTVPTNLYAYRTSSTEVNFTFTGHGSTSYEVSFSTLPNSNTNNILSYNSTSGTVGGSFSTGTTYYFRVRGKCPNGTFTNWVYSVVQ